MKTALTFFIAAAFMIMPLGAFAQQGKPSAPSGSGQYSESTQGGQRDQFRAEHEKMMKDMDARLDAKVAAMDAATGEKKIDAMEGVIKEMVAQRKEMREHMEKMRERFSQHMKNRKGASSGDADRKDNMQQEFH